MSIITNCLIFVFCVVSVLATCRYSNNRLNQVICENFDTNLEWKDISSFPNLEKLFLRNITGSLIMTNFTLDSLKYMYVTRSLIEDFELGTFPDLVFLGVIKNQKFPNLTEDLLKQATHLQWLSLVGNNHTITPSAFHSLTNLTWLHIQNENLQHLSDEFLKENRNLHELSIRNCQLEQIDVNAFAQTPEIEILSLNFNKISHFEMGTFNNLKKLKILELHHNNFMVFDLNQFRGLITLEVFGPPSTFWKSFNSNNLVKVLPNLKKIEVKKRDLKKFEVKQRIRELRSRGIDIIGTPYEV